MTRRLLAGLALIALAIGFAPAPADAASIVFCRSASPGTAAGPARFTAPGSGNAYQLDRAGCTLGLVTDIGDFQANGFTQSGPLRAIVITGATAQIQVGNLPPSAYIQAVIAQETSGRTMSFGVKLGTTAGGTDIISGMNVTSFSLTNAADVSFAKRVFSQTQAQAVFLDAVTAWNGASVVLTILYSFF